MSVGPNSNPYPHSSRSRLQPPIPTPPYRVARRATAWVLYAAIAPTTVLVLFHLAQGTLTLLHSVWSTLAT